MIETFNTHRQLLFGIAYRMLGRVSEAEDMVQEVWLRWQKQGATEIRSPKAWLVSAMTRLCIDQLRSARREREEYYGVWLPEPLVEPAAIAPDESAALADSLSMAFMLMLETLGPVERAVFLLREVFDYDYPEIAGTVGKTEANCRQIVRRAKQQLLATPSSVPTPSVQARRVVEQFVNATITGEVNDLLALLTDDATLYSDGGGQVVAVGRPIESADHISRFFMGIRRFRHGDTKLRFMGINGRPGVLMISEGKIFNAISFELVGERVHNIYIIRNPDKLRHLAAIGQN